MSNKGELSLLTVAEAHKLVKRQKRLVAPMAWAKKLNHTEPVWYEFRSAVEFEDDQTQTPEGLQLICQWKRKDGVKPENWTFGLICGSCRLYALDVQPLTFHTNRVGVGRPLHLRRISGTHEHTWSDDGYGYAEPFALDPIDGLKAWQEFLIRAHIAYTAFVHPDKAINDGQQELNL